MFSACAITLFPNFFDQFIETSLIGKAIADRKFRFSSINPRDFSEPPHFRVDDTPYGGGAGMVMRPEPLVAAIERAQEVSSTSYVIAPSASGQTFTQQVAQRLAGKQNLIFVCGRYEGIDQRVLDHHVDEEISLGNYVVMGGEAPTTIMLEAIVRLLPGVIGNSDSLRDESHTKNGYIEAPQYTRPESFRGKEVPAVLRSGNHKLIAEWRAKESLKQSVKRQEQREK